MQLKQKHQVIQKQKEQSRQKNTGKSINITIKNRVK